MSARLSVLRDTFARAARQAAETGEPVLASASFPLRPLNLFDLIASWDDAITPWFFHETGDPSVALFGWDRAFELSATGDARFAQLDARWRALGRTAVIAGPQPPRIGGGFRFDPHGPRQAHWQSFADASMMLAKVMIVREGDAYWAVCQHVVAAHDDPAALARERIARLDMLATLAPAPDDDAPHLLRTQALQAGEWQGKVRRAVAAIRRDELSKVVLARDVQQQYAQPVAIGALLRRLRRRDAHAHLFAIRNGDGCFVGATPERLARVADGKAQTHALAGTIRRGADPDSDRALGAELMASAKERLEHALVVDAIRGALAPLSRTIDVPAQPSLQRLPRLQHLSTPIGATLNADATLLQVVAALHPTPAVAGHPRAIALEHIRAHEGFDRGWYAGPIGWIDAHGNGDFVVALRSALIAGRACRLFAGCGIVADSEPEREYQETNLKLSGMQAAIELCDIADNLRKVASIPSASR
ncbi:isochorismate synthase [Burkholderia oklahomensis]|uniref:isochorismate synthase n=1 Tax=Burkholderia oklahomensis TaxID=342113 RepID=UPI00016AA222|nr:isochorismate synthase [Burkholderia oklahomensis]AJX35996.1 isochorismate synthase family protein [Burkholderia oklahomensis C6786]AOI49507.1 salicylate biosynthesis isochorismate synthase [Burkholderia oklahomensis C6786]KUY62211.1 salicylate biosynthesis isochorismate synthase [Burkholderia oklahomensis C6786]MBI0362217.1 isochorismate synthase [Burkholderia oklahomensis]SUY26323.1 Isochorismate synthase dhbC [Burkholderia oklahomensis]